MRKSPFTCSGTPTALVLCWTSPSFAQNSVAKYARTGVASNAVACARKQTLALNLDTPAHPHYGLKVPDHPDLASGWHAKHGCIC
jgi:hypothetical protein